MAGESVKLQIEAKEKMLLQNDIRKAQQIEHDYLDKHDYLKVQP